MLIVKLNMNKIMSTVKGRNNKYDIIISLYSDKHLLYIKDNNSTNGTFLDNKKIKDKVLVNSYQKISIGNYVLKIYYKIPEIVN